jgi:hypothetical protein
MPLKLTVAFGAAAYRQVVRRYEGGRRVGDWRKERSMLWLTLRKFKSGDPNTRCAVALALGKSGQPKAAEALLRACDDLNPEVRFAVLKGLALFALTLQHRHERAELGHGRRLSPDDLTALGNALAAINRFRAEEQQKKPSSAAAGKEEATEERRHEIQRGGFGEPYCSEACYDQAGRAMATARLTGAAGACEYCKSVIGPRHVTLVKRGRLVFICQSCAARVQAEIRALSRCYMCDAPLA